MVEYPTPDEPTWGELRIKGESMEKQCCVCRQPPVVGEEVSHGYCRECFLATVAISWDREIPAEKEELELILDTEDYFVKK